MRVRYLSAALVLVAAITMVGISGCSQVKTKLDTTLAPKPLPPVTIEATVAAAGASVEGTISSTFPDTMPVWPGARVKKSQTLKTPQGNSYALVLKTTDPFADVLAGMSAGLKKSSWKTTVTDASSAEASASLFMIANTRYEGIITVSEDASATTRIEYTLTPKK